MRDYPCDPPPRSFVYRCVTCIPDARFFASFLAQPLRCIPCGSSLSACRSRLSASCHVAMTDRVPARCTLDVCFRVTTADCSTVLVAFRRLPCFHGGQCVRFRFPYRFPQTGSIIADTCASMRPCFHLATVLPVCVLPCLSARVLPLLALRLDLACCDRLTDRNRFLDPSIALLTDSRHYTS